MHNTDPVPGDDPSPTEQFGTFAPQGQAQATPGAFAPPGGTGSGQGGYPPPAGGPGGQPPRATFAGAGRYTPSRPPGVQPHGGGSRTDGSAGVPGRGAAGRVGPGHRQAAGWPPEDRPPADRPGDGRHQGRRARRSRSGWLLLIPLAAPLASPFTNSDHPELWGIPFFYWFQMACTLLAAAVIATVFVRSRSRA